MDIMHINKQKKIYILETHIARIFLKTRINKI